MESSGDMSHQCVCCGGLSSPAVTSLRCARPARDEDVQVILVGFQGDGNERSGHPSQYIHTHRHTHTQYRMKYDQYIVVYCKHILRIDVRTACAVVWKVHNPICSKHETCFILRVS